MPPADRESTAGRWDFEETSNRKLAGSLVQHRFTLFRLARFAALPMALAAGGICGVVLGLADALAIRRGPGGAAYSRSPRAIR